MSPPILFTNGQPIKLGRRIGKGGEGEVYSIEGRSDEALKFYTVDSLGDRGAKVHLMVGAGLARASKLVSYPSAVVTDSKDALQAF